MSIFKKKKVVSEYNDVVVPEIVPSNAVGDSSSSSLMNRRMDIEQSRLDNQRSMIDCVNNAIPVVTNGLRDIAGFVSQCYTMHQQSEQMRMMTNVQLANITAKYKVTQDYMEKAFGERGKALDKYYATLDKAIECNDREMIIAAMQSISTVVAQSPLQDIEKFTALFNDTSKPLLDF